MMRISRKAATSPVPQLLRALDDGDAIDTREHPKLLGT